MTVQTEPLPHESIVILHIMPPVAAPDDVLNSLQAVVDFKRTVPGHVTRICDFTAFTAVADIPISVLIQGMDSERNAAGGINDPDVSSIYVGSSQWVKFGAEAISSQAQYGKTNVTHICATVDEALALARQDNKAR